VARTAPRRMAVHPVAHASSYLLVDELRMWIQRCRSSTHQCSRRDKRCRCDLEPSSLRTIGEREPIRAARSGRRDERGLEAAAACRGGKTMRATSIEADALAPVSAFDHHAVANRAPFASAAKLAATAINLARANALPGPAVASPPIPAARDARSRRHSGLSRCRRHDATRPSSTPNADAGDLAR